MLAASIAYPCAHARLDALLRAGNAARHANPLSAYVNAMSDRALWPMARSRYVKLCQLKSYVTRCQNALEAGKGEKERKRGLAEISYRARADNALTYIFFDNK